MKVNVCLVCLKTFDSSSAQFAEWEKWDSSFLRKFLKFTENFLKISTAELILPENAREMDSFCEQCKLAVINPLCKVYQELLSVQLRLAWELRKMGRLFENSQGCASDELKLLKNQLLATQLGMGRVAHLEEFRSLLTAKCHEKGSLGQPKIIAELSIISPTFGFKEVVKREVGIEVPTEQIIPLPGEYMETTTEQESEADEEDFEIETECIIKLEAVDDGHNFTVDCENEDDDDPTFLPEDSYSDSEQSTSSLLSLISSEQPQQPSISALKKRKQERKSSRWIDTKVNGPSVLPSLANTAGNEPVNKSSPDPVDNSANQVSETSEVSSHGSEGDLMFQCDRCPKRCRSKPNLRYHVNATHLKLRWSCPKGCRTFTTAYGLEYHLAKGVCKKRKGHDCKYCGEKWTIPTNLRRHSIACKKNRLQESSSDC